MGGSVTIQMTPEKKKYLRIDFAGITPNAQLKVIKVKFKQTDGSIVYITPNPSFTTTINCIEVAYELDQEPFTVNDESFFTTAYMSHHFDVLPNNFQEYESKWQNSTAEYY